jgi:hypothetical protein
VSRVIDGVHTGSGTTLRRSLVFSLGVAVLAWVAGVVVFGAADLVAQLVVRGDGPPVSSASGRVN